MSMLSCVRLPVTTSYRVEVSGWDSAHNFFVEKSELEWNEDSGKQLNLRRAVRDCSLLFIRLIHSSAAERSQPVAYEAEFLGITRSGEYGFRLHAVPANNSADSFPRHPETASVSDW
jgi:hypothetical protein